MVNDKRGTRSDTSPEGWVFWIPCSWLMISGLAPQLTVTVNEQVAEAPVKSMARHTLMVIPTGNTEELARPLSRYEVVPEQLSVAVGEG